MGYASYPNQDPGSDVTFTECFYWSELNADIDDVLNEVEVIDEASDIPEFSSLLMPVASVLAIVGLNSVEENYRFIQTNLTFLVNSLYI